MSLKSKVLSLAASVSLMIGASGVNAAYAVEPVKNIVLVHGAFIDGSSWKAVYDILKRHGYNVSIVQHPETSLAADIAATKRILDQQSGPSILVGHSYGGAVITGAGLADNVAGLVYIAAFQPDKGESAMSLAKGLPASTNGVRPTADGFLFWDPKEYHADFGADLQASDAEFMSHAQVPIAGAAFGEPLQEVAWKVKPTWAIVATEDKALNPELERTMYKRSNSKVTEIKSSHAVYVSHPAEVAKVIEDAARNSAK